VEALDYTRWLANHHYENFHVVSWLLPKKLHQDFYNVYSFCRWADDLGDEIGEKQESLRLLAWWSEQLDRMYEGEAEHPVFMALRETARKHTLPKELFADLIHAFVQVEDLFAGRENAAFQAVIRELVERTRPLFMKGLPLIQSVDWRLALDLDLFGRGGMRVLEKIEQQDYKVLHRRPVISKTDRIVLLLGSMVRVIILRAA
jgi:phytoene/squalene synthetase